MTDAPTALEIITEAIPVDSFDDEGEAFTGIGDDGEYLWGPPEDVARTIHDALRDAGHLVASSFMVDALYRPGWYPAEDGS